MHFIGEPHIRMLRKPWAMVTVRLAKSRDKFLTVEGEISIAKEDVEWTALPDGFEVRDPTGGVITPSKGRQFYVTVNTFDPVHGLTEADPRDMR